MTRPLLLGHRGARSTVAIPENTVASFDLALQHGCDGFEFDVRRTADGVLVVCHDESFRGLRLAETHARDLAAWQTEGFLPQLDDVLQRFAPRCFLDIEIKDRGVEPQVLDLLHRHQIAHGCVVTSFHTDVLVRLRELDPAIELGFLFDQDSHEKIALCRSLRVQWVLPEACLLDKALAAELRDTRKTIGVWTVNDSADMLRLAALGAEMLISDDTVGLVNTFPVI
jgi:glycerophosphoryl diester phosphodiesterase